MENQRSSDTFATDVDILRRGDNMLTFPSDSLEKLREKLNDKELTIKIEGIGKYLLEFAVIASATFLGSTLGSYLGKVFVNGKRVAKLKKALTVLLS